MIAILDANDLDVILQAVLRKLRYIVDNYQLKWQRSQVQFPPNVTFLLISLAFVM